MLGPTAAGKRCVYIYRWGTDLCMDFVRYSDNHFPYVTVVFCIQPMQSERLAVSKAPLR